MAAILGLIALLWIAIVAVTLVIYTSRR